MVALCAMFDGCELRVLLSVQVYFSAYNGSYSKTCRLKKRFYWDRKRAFLYVYGIQIRSWHHQSS